MSEACDHDPARPGPPVRWVFHWGHQAGPSLWGGAGFEPPRPPAGFPVPHQAARRPAGQGRLLGVQFCAILEDGLYFELARHADRLAMELRRAFETRGYEMLFDSYTNQQYPILPDGLLAQLEEEFALTVWSKVDGGHTAVRVCTSWATELSFWPMAT